LWEAATSAAYHKALQSSSLLHQSSVHMGSLSVPALSGLLQHGSSPKSPVVAPQALLDHSGNAVEPASYCLKLRLFSVRFLRVILLVSCLVPLLYLGSAYAQLRRIDETVLASTLEGTLPQGSFFTKYLGGFCFGHSPKELVSEIVGSVELHLRYTSQGEQPPCVETRPRVRGSLTFLFFDEQHWHNTTLDHPRADWATHEHTVYLSAIDCSGNLRYPDTTPDTVNFREHSNHQWHIVVVGSDVYRQGANSELQYDAIGIKALSKWEGNTRNPAKCQSQPWDYVRDSVAKFEAAYIQV
jgi:hypothetical protein